MKRIMSIGVVISVLAAGCGSSASSASNSSSPVSTTPPGASASSAPAPSTTTPPAAVTRSSLGACLRSGGAAPKSVKEMGFSPPGGALSLSIPGDNRLIVGVFPNTQYAQAAADGVVAIGSGFVGETTAKQNTHVVGTVVWFPAQSPYTGQHLAALDKCLA